ncbi:aminopeptidase P family protein [Temperatibacter marinus]|uniref:Aminopeptidase P family protein n=1 Tax=Temperatibacter marinus TaxID=1456591 RepID=A0AA52EIS4_9PROT|nr:aminopeptidase P family protein [Temperatibacter marinus]WND03059.1 aminopeptidase P family protein [Temperatibacter marinus]
MSVATNLEALRGELKAQGLSAFLIPITDEHMSEYVGDYAQRITWATGFAGSAGNAAIGLDAAAVFIDGRYTIQVKQEVDGTLFGRHHFQEYPMLKWLQDHVTSGEKVGYDPELATIEFVESLQLALDKVGAVAVAVDQNPVDIVWESQPAEPLSPVVMHDAKYAGKTAAEKRTDIAAELEKKGADSAVITMLDSVAWAFNIRGKDVLNTPVVHAFALMHKDETADLFVEQSKVSDDVRTALGNAVRIRPREEFYSALQDLGRQNSTVLVDATTNNSKVFKSLEKAGATLVKGQDPCILPKAVKNPVEQQGTRDAHIRDGAAISKMLHWLSIEAPKGEIDELDCVDKLWSFRKELSMINDRSFDTISGAGPNGALCHYRVSEETNRKLDQNSLYLFDSGGQFNDGTTDITRTIAVGTPTAEMIENYTRVLKGHIQLTLMKFPQGTSGAALDTIARKPLWDVGLDYDHGTGHGVGSYLAVHEGPQRIAKGNNEIPLQAGMILSNEPGYYKAEEYGIRIENLVLVKELEGTYERPMLGFENLTWAPLDPTLIDRALLTEEEKQWVNDYHATVLEMISPQIDGEAADWLKKVCAPI